MNCVKLPIPPLEEQKVILDYLSKRTSKIDVAIDEANNMISLLQERKQIIINEVVTGKVKVG
ncbi:MAG: restriction endonuclease subunit S [Bacteroidales bacterium]|nr:restriction endonuclease subunit S [Bacteroidales bacterium]